MVDLKHNDFNIQKEFKSIEHRAYVPQYTSLYEAISMLT